MGRTIRSKSIYTGRNYDVGAFRDDHYVRCSRCGYINNMDQAIHSNDGGYEGWGTTMTAVTSTDGGTGYGGTKQALPQNFPLQGELMYSTSCNSTDTFSNTYGTFSFQLTQNNNTAPILLNGSTSGLSAVMMLLYNSGIYAVNNSSQWYQYTGTWGTISGDPRVGNKISYTTDAVVGAGCFQCGTLLYTK